MRHDDTAAAEHRAESSPLLAGLWHNFGTNDDYANMKRMCYAAFDRGVTHF
ncbi:MAG: hypothetical protein R2912_11920 [Eubacteriales bacterium]